LDKIFVGQKNSSLSLYFDISNNTGM